PWRGLPGTCGDTLLLLRRLHPRSSCRPPRQQRRQLQPRLPPLPPYGVPLLLPFPPEQRLRSTPPPWEDSHHPPALMAAHPQGCAHCSCCRQRSAAEAGAAASGTEP
ncbi:unnamed protein product, partial [Ectocarpus sp. 12 AP-2014]